MIQFYGKITLSVTTVQINLDENTKKDICNLYASLKPVKLYNCFYNKDNGEILEKTFISFYNENNNVDSIKCYNYEENKKVQKLNTRIMNKLKSTKNL